MKVYKAFVDHNGGLYSWNVAPRARDFSDSRRSLYYKVGKWTRPTIKGSLLYAFRTLKSAKRFLKNSGFQGDCICECEANEITVPRKYIAAFFSDRLLDMEIFWASKGNCNIPCFYKSQAPGTIWCSSIKPLRRID